MNPKQTPLSPLSLMSARETRAARWVLERYDILGERMLPDDMTPPFPSETRLRELAAILAQQYFIARPAAYRLENV